MKREATGAYHNLRSQLERFESINGIKLTLEECNYLIDVATLNNVTTVSPAKPEEFSKSKSFFMQPKQKNSLVFVENGHWVSHLDIATKRVHFLAYLLDKKKGEMILYGYYPEELDSM